MIVVGIVAPGSPGGGGGAGGVVEIARRSASAGVRSEIVGVVPAGPAGDRQLLSLATAGVGHATVIRSAASTIEAADLDLALHYLPDVGAIVLVAPDAPLVAVAVAAAGWSGAALVVVGPVGADAIAVLDAADGRPILLQPPARDPDGAFAGLVAALALRLNAGEDPGAAWRATVAALAIDPA